MSNGKGDTPRPLSVPQETYASNWDKIFSGKSNNTCHYSGLPSVNSFGEQEKEIPDEEYTAALRSGLFWELFPELTGHWETDKLSWRKLHK